MYDRPHYLFSFGGTAISGLEIWQTGLRFAPPAGTTVDVLLANLDNISVADMFADFAAIIANTDSNLSYPSTVKATFAKLAPIGVDGKYVGAPKIHEGLAVGKNPTTSTHVPQLAIVATLATGHSFGMAQKGRMYWPPPVAFQDLVTGATGQLPQAYVDQFRDQVANAITASQGEADQVGWDVYASVMSKSGGVSAPQAPGTTNSITEVSVGRVMDTQRRRRSELQEGYSPTPAGRSRRDAGLQPRTWPPSDSD